MAMILVLGLLSTSLVLAEEPKGQPRAGTDAATAGAAQPAVEKAIRENADAFVSAFNKGDAKAVAALWTADCEYVGAKVQKVLGRSAIEKEYAQFFKAKPGVTIETAVSSVKVLGPSTALEEGTTMLKSAKGKLLSIGYYSAVDVKENGKWLLASVREHAAPSEASRSKLADLDWLIGTWTADGKSGTAKLTFKWMVDKKFIELAYEVKAKKGISRSGVQIIGESPSSGHLVSWSFFPNGGSGRSRWRPFGNGWIVESFGRMPNGTRTMSTYLISRDGNNSFTWKSVNRRIAGKRLKDTATVTLKRKAL
jgi:uncharacterized protein (TIGR02246 family)